MAVMKNNPYSLIVFGALDKPLAPSICCPMPKNGDTILVQAFIYASVYLLMGSEFKYPCDAIKVFTGVASFYFDDETVKQIKIGWQDDLNKKLFFYSKFAIDKHWKITDGSYETHSQMYMDSNLNFRTVPATYKVTPESIGMVILHEIAKRANEKNPLPEEDFYDIL